MKTLRFIAALLLLAPGIAFGQARTSTAPYAGPYATATTGQKVIQRTNILAWLPGTGLDAATALDFTNGGSGHTSLFAYEMPDDVTAVAVIYANGNNAPWTVGGASLSVSSQWGGGSGIIAYNRAGVADPTFLPVTFKNGGRASMPFPGTFSGFPGSSTGGSYLLSLNLTSASTNTLTFTGGNSGNIQTSDLTAALSPVANMYVWDTLGCIPANTTVSSTTTTTVVMSANSSGCQAGQLIAFSWTPPGALSVTIPASTNIPSPVIAVSDWVPVLSRTRLDHVLQGETLTGNACVLANTIITSVNQESIVVSPGVASNCGGNSLNATTTSTTTSDTPSGYVIQIAANQLVQVGQLLSGSTSIPSSDVVDALVDSTHILIHTAVTADLPAATTLTFTNKVQMTGAAQTAGQTILPVIGTTNGRPLLEVRTIASGAGQPWARSWPANTALTENNLYGFPGVTSVKGAAGVDLVNFPNGSLSGNTSDITLPWGLLFQTRHNGIQIIVNGDSHIAGDTTGSGSANFARRAGYALAAANQNIPIEVFNATRGAQSEQEWQPILADILQLARPGVVVQLAGTMNGAAQYIDPAWGIDALRVYGQANGTKSVIATDYPKGSNSPMSTFLAAPMSNQSTGTMSIFSPGSTNVSGATVTCIGCSAGLTANLTYLSSSVTFSSPQTLPAGTLIHFNIIPGTTNGTTALTLSTPVPYAVSNLFANGTNIPANDTVNCSINSTACTLAVAATGTGSTNVTFTSIAASEPIRNPYNALAYRLADPNSPVTIFDLAGMVSNPSGSSGNFGAVMNDGYSWDGVHCDDYCHGLAGQALQSILQQSIGN